MNTQGRVICARCAAGRVVVKLTDTPKLEPLMLDEDLRARLLVLVAVAPEEVP